MQSKIKVAIIGLDTSHAVAMPKLIQDPETPPENRISGLQVTRCLRFPSPFQSTEGMDVRQKYLESIGVTVTENFAEAVADCDALMLNINDPALHLEYFTRCAALGKRIFLDKPFADTLDNACRIDAVARKHHTGYFTASSLRFAADVTAAVAGKTFTAAHLWGPVGTAASGSSIIWYGVHTFEMLQKILGRGASQVMSVADPDGWQCLVTYPDGRRGVVELSRSRRDYGGMLRDTDGRETLFHESGTRPLYYMMLEQVEKFFRTGTVPVAVEDSLEVMAMLEAADKSALSRRPEAVFPDNSGDIHQIDEP